MPHQHATGQGKPRARWVASPRRRGIRRPPQFLYCYNRRPHGIREPALYLWTPRMYWHASMHCPGPLAIHPPLSTTGLEPGHSHINPTALATSHNPSSTQSTHHGLRGQSPGALRQAIANYHAFEIPAPCPGPEMATALNPPSRATDTTQLSRTTPLETTPLHLAMASFLDFRSPHYYISSKPANYPHSRGHCHGRHPGRTRNRHLKLPCLS